MQDLSSYVKENDTDKKELELLNDIIGMLIKADYPNMVEMLTNNKTKTEALYNLGGALYNVILPRLNGSGSSEMIEIPFTRADGDNAILYVSIIEGERKNYCTLYDGTIYMTHYNTSDVADTNRILLGTITEGSGFYGYVNCVYSGSDWVSCLGAVEFQDRKMYLIVGDKTPFKESADVLHIKFSGNFTQDFD